MRRKLLMVLLGFGAVAGFGAGFARLAGHGRFGHDRHREWESRVADACTESALRVYAKKSGAGAAP